MNDLVIVGAGHGDIIKLIGAINSYKNQWNILGFVDTRENLWGIELMGYPVLGGNEYLKELRDIYVAINVGLSSSRRKKAFDNVAKYGHKFATLVHPSVDTSYVNLSDGVIIYEHVSIGFGVSVGFGTVIWKNVSIGHDTMIGEYCVINPGSIINGRVTIGNETLIGSGSVIIHEVDIGEKVTIGMGTRVFKNIPSGITIVESPRYITLKNFKKHGSD